MIWYDEVHELDYEYEAPVLTVHCTEREVVGMLLGPKGEVLLEIMDRPPVGYRRA